MHPKLEISTHRCQLVVNIGLYNMSQGHLKVKVKVAYIIETA